MRIANQRRASQGFRADQKRQIAKKRKSRRKLQKRAAETVSARASERTKSHRRKKICVLPEFQPGEEINHKALDRNS